MELDRLRPSLRIRRLGVALVAGAIFYGSVLVSPDSGLPALGPLGLVGLDKWLHALAYATLAVALVTAFAPRRPLATAAALAAAVALAYGIGIEFAQAAVPERHFSVPDMVADSVGAAAGVACWRAGIEAVRRLESGSASSEAEPPTDRDA